MFVAPCHNSGIVELYSRVWRGGGGVPGSSFRPKGSPYPISMLHFRSSTKRQFSKLWSLLGARISRIDHIRLLCLEFELTCLLGGEGRGGGGEGAVEFCE